MISECTEKVLFSADGFGKFGALDVEEDWDDEARRYFIGIVGKYGPQVQDLLKAASGLDISVICPLHGQNPEEKSGTLSGKIQYVVLLRYRVGGRYDRIYLCLRSYEKGCGDFS